MADQETHAILSENVCLTEEKFEHDIDLRAISEMVAVTGSCLEAAVCSNVADVAVSDGSQTSVASVPAKENHNIVPTLADMANSKCHQTEISQPALYVASCQDTSCGSAHNKAQETVSAESPLPLSSNTDTNMSATADVCSLLSDLNFHSQTDSQPATLVTDKAVHNIEETVRRPVETEVGSSLTKNAMTMDQAKSSAVVSTPEVQSVKCPVVQSSHSARQIKCRKTGHRRITANGANLSLGQLINAVSESCLTEGLDSTYMPSSSLSSRSNAIEHRMITPVKAADAAESGVIKENLFRNFDCESSGSPATSSTTDAQGSPQVVDGVRRPPRARKSCHSNDLPKEPSTPAGTTFGTVCLAELVDTQSLNKLDVRSFDELLLAKMRERMRPSNGFKLLPHNNEHPHIPAAEEAAFENLNNRVQGLDSGTPLIPSPANAARLSNEKQVIYCSSAKVTSLPGESGRKQIWRCRKSNSSPSSKVNGVVKHSGEKPSDSDVTAEASETSRRSPRCAKRSPSWQHLGEVRQLLVNRFNYKQELRSVEHGICPIAEFTSP